MDHSTFSAIASNSLDLCSSVGTSPGPRETHDTMNPLPPPYHRATSSVYSRTQDHETSSTYWSTEAPPSMPTNPDLAELDRRSASESAFREEHDEIDAMMKDMATDDEECADETTLNDLLIDAPHSPTTPASVKSPRQRDLSERTFVDALRTDSATSGLIKAIVRVCWVDNMQQRLVQAAVLIHRDLRGCFHTQVFTHNTARRATEIITSINEVLNSWQARMVPLQKAIESIDVNRDTPNLMNIHKEDHGEAMKRFKMMLVPIPTELGAECNAKIVKLMKQLFDDEVRLPFERMIASQETVHPAEATARSYLVVLDDRFVEVDSVAEQLRLSTNMKWDHWNKMSEQIAEQAAFLNSNTPAALTIRAKDAISRILHNSLGRSDTKRKGIPRTSDGRILISSPVAADRPQPREASVRNTRIDIPLHPLDAAPPNFVPPDEAFAQLLPASAPSPSSSEGDNHKNNSPGIFTPHTQFTPHHIITSIAGSANMQDATPRTRHSDTPTISDALLQSECNSEQDNPFTQWESLPYIPINGLEYFHNHLNAPYIHETTSDGLLGVRSSVSPPGQRSLSSKSASDSEGDHSMIVDGAAYYDMLKSFYEMDPERPNRSDDPELYALWYRSMALRSLEGGPAPELCELLGPAEAMEVVQRAFGPALQRQRSLIRRREREEMRRQRAELDDLDAELRLAVLEQKEERDKGSAGREKRALRESMTILDSEYDNQGDLFENSRVISKALTFPSYHQEGPEDGESACDTRGILKREFVFPPRDQESNMQPERHDPTIGPIGHGEMVLQERSNSAQSFYDDDDDDDDDEFYDTDDEEPWRRI